MFPKSKGSSTQPKRRRTSKSDKGTVTARVTGTKSKKVVFELDPAISSSKVFEGMISGTVLKITVSKKSIRISAI